MSTTISVNVEPAYDVVIGEGILNGIADRILEVSNSKKFALISDTNVAPLYAEKVAAPLRDAGVEVFEYVYEAGEESKNIETLSAILEFMAESKLDRKSCAIALGGGVCGDITGFASATYMRGIDCIQIPTTLLSAVDSSIGGKTAIDLKAGKNLAGAFHQPIAVFCDIETFNTLPYEQMSNGMGEVIKTSVLVGGRLFEIVKSGEALDHLEEVVSLCAQYKADVVTRDQFDNGERHLLNLGHTFGHAIEVLSGFKTMHGEAVSAGLALVTRAAIRMDWIDIMDAISILDAPYSYDLPISTPFTADKIAQIALIDKKRDGDEIELVVPTGIGTCEVKRVSVNELESIIESGLQ